MRARGSAVDPAYLGQSVACHDQAKITQVEYCEAALRQKDVRPASRQKVQDAVKIDMYSWVDQRTCITLDLVVVALSTNKDGDLLHVRCPVNLGVCDGDQHYCPTTHIASDSQGTVFMIRAHSTASMVSSAGATHRDCFGSFARSQAISTPWVRVCMADCCRGPILRRCVSC